MSHDFERFKSLAARLQLANGIGLRFQARVLTHKVALQTLKVSVSHSVCLSVCLQLEMSGTWLTDDSMCFLARALTHNDALQTLKVSVSLLVCKSACLKSEMSSTWLTDNDLRFLARAFTQKVAL